MSGMCAICCGGTSRDLVAFASSLSLIAANTGIFQRDWCGNSGFLGAAMQAASNLHFGGQRIMTLER